MSIKKSIFDSLETQIETSTEEQDSGFFTISLKNKELLRKKIINFSDDFGKTQIGQLVASEVFTRNLNDNFENLEINFLKNMKSDFLDIFAYAEEKLSKEQISQLVKIKLFSNEGEASSDIFSVGKHLVITIKKNILSDFVIDAFVNRSLFESLKKAKESDTLFINSGFLTSLLIRTDENSNLEKVIVKRFSGNKEFFESDSNKMFRIQTNYGIGYISLDYDGRKKNSDLYRICVGYDNNDQPIIKFLNF